MHNEMCTGLVDVAQMAERTIALQEQVIESDWKLQKTHCEIQIAHNTVLEARHFALSRRRPVHVVNSLKT